MKLSKEISVKVGHDGLIVLREPTNKEWNEFINSQVIWDKRTKATFRINEAREELFDKLVIKIENIEDDDGLITLEGKHRIPSRIKTKIITEVFELEEIDVKN